MFLLHQDRYLKKYKLILLGSKRKTNLFANVNVRINGHVLERVEKCNYLGVVIDREFSWRPYIDTVRSKGPVPLHLRMQRGCKT